MEATKFASIIGSLQGHVDQAHATWESIDVPAGVLPPGWTEQIVTMTSSQLAEFGDALTAAPDWEWVLALRAAVVDEVLSR